MAELVDLVEAHQGAAGCASGRVANLRCQLSHLRECACKQHAHARAACFAPHTPLTRSTPLTPSTAPLPIQAAFNATKLAAKDSIHLVNSSSENVADRSYTGRWKDGDVLWQNSTRPCTVDSPAMGIDALTFNVKSSLVTSTKQAAGEAELTAAKVPDLDKTTTDHTKRHAAPGISSTFVSAMEADETNHLAADSNTSKRGAGGLTTTQDAHSGCSLESAAINKIVSANSSVHPHALYFSTATGIVSGEVRALPCEKAWPLLSLVRCSLLSAIGAL